MGCVDGDTGGSREQAHSGLWPWGPALRSCPATSLPLHLRTRWLPRAHVRLLDLPLPAFPVRAARLPGTPCVCTRPPGCPGKGRLARAFCCAPRPPNVPWGVSCFRALWGAGEGRLPQRPGVKAGPAAFERRACGRPSECCASTSPLTRRK